MALKNYYLRPPSVVILADDRDPYVSWQNHLARTGGQRGGVDLVAPIGTPVFARTAGRMIQVPNNGSAGNSTLYSHRDNPGWKDVFSHLSSYKTPKNPSGINGFDYEAGDIVCYTGNTGGVDPHLHWHLLDPSNVRRNPWDYFSSGTAGGGVSPIPIEEIMALKDVIELFYHKDRGYIALGPGFVYKVGDSDGLTGDAKLKALGAIGIQPKTIDLAAWDGLNIIFQGNQALANNAKYTASLIKPQALSPEDKQAVIDGVIAGIGSDIDVSAEKLREAAKGITVSAVPAATK